MGKIGGGKLEDWVAEIKKDLDEREDTSTEQMMEAMEDYESLGRRAWR